MENKFQIYIACSAYQQYDSKIPSFGTSIYHVITESNTDCSNYKYDILQLTPYKMLSNS